MSEREPVPADDEPEPTDWHDHWAGVSDARQARQEERDRIREELA